MVAVRGEISKDIVSDSKVCFLKLIEKARFGFLPDAFLL